MPAACASVNFCPLPTLIKCPSAVSILSPRTATVEPPAAGLEQQVDVPLDDAVSRPDVDIVPPADSAISFKKPCIFFIYAAVSFPSSGGAYRWA